jgi:hypothetical protein
MDASLKRILPQLSPKPRLLVCAPSNAATDELLARVLDRGFIDGELRSYKPNVARVGLDFGSPAAQAVSVERRANQVRAVHFFCMETTVCNAWRRNVEVSRGENVRQLYGSIGPAQRTAGQLESLAKNCTVGHGMQVHCFGSAFLVRTFLRHTFAARPKASRWAMYLKRPSLDCAE